MAAQQRQTAKAMAARGDCSNDGDGGVDDSDGASGRLRSCPSQAHVVLSHVPVENYDFRQKELHIGTIARRVFLVHLGKMPLDDGDYCYGKTRL
ncbi:MAG: hypothetical protein ACRDL7_06425 [Gaiellaceae bacterium]